MAPSGMLDKKSQKLFQKKWEDLDDDERSNVVEIISYDLLNQEQIMIANHEEMGAPKGKTWVEKELACGNDCDPMEGFWSFEELQALVANMPFDPKEAKLLVGTRMS